MNEFSVISPAMFNLFKECELKFYYQYVEQINYPTLDENYVEGKNIHNLASYVLKGNSVEKYEAQLSDNELKYWSNLKKSKYFSYELVGVEKSLMMKIDEFWVGGRLDAIVKNGSDYFVLDYKTGGVNSDKTYDYQTMVYLLLCDEVFKDRDSLTFVYIDLKNDKEVKVLFNDELKKEYFERILSACNGMKNVTLNKTVCTDVNCQYSKLCNVSNY
ncbi:PD-(D/E)XK nuclease family protein [bacterium]|nr:PD-(D/E)XK nuclease family protein [bacterium]